jgi:hypothetical protein
MAVHFFDIYAAIGLGLVCVPVTAWLGILFNHHKTLKVGTERVQVLIVRNSLFLPAYAILLWLSLVFPVLYPILEGPIAIAEGEQWHPLPPAYLSVSLTPSLLTRLLSQRFI